MNSSDKSVYCMMWVESKTGSGREEISQPF